MDFKVSRRERIERSDGPAEVLMDNACELYPIYDKDDPNLIVDVEVIDDERAELLDRAAFAAIKQRGLDPLDPGSGVQWAEHALGEVAAPVIMQQAVSAVAGEGPGARVSISSQRSGGVERAVFKIELVS
jgi:hypothetical protein